MPWAKKVPVNSIGIIIIMHCWVYNINKSNMYNGNTTEKGKWESSYVAVKVL